MSGELSGSAGRGRPGRGVSPAAVCIDVLLALCALFTLFPLYMCLLNSVKTNGEILNNILALPKSPAFSNYSVTFERMQYFRSILNTILVVAVGLGGMIVFASMAGYKLSRVHTKLSNFLFGLFIMSMLIPFSAVMITLNKIAHDLHLQDSSIGLGLIYVGLGVPMAIFLYHGFVKSIPKEMEEAAHIDGCGEFRTFFIIVFPLLRPATATIAILNTLWMWNDFLLPLLVLPSSDHYTLLLSINMLFGEYGNNDWASIMAALILAMLPVAAFYLALQKYIMKGIAAGAIKG